MKITTNKRILWVLAAAVALCIISAAGIYMFLAPQRGTVYVFREDYTAGNTGNKRAADAYRSRCDHHRDGRSGRHQ